MNISLPPAPDQPAAPGTYRCGTLVYTRAGLAALFFWLLWGDFCYVLMEVVVPSLMPLRFQALNASNSSIGLILVTIPMTINTVFNPIISFRSDRFRSRWGRRIPFVLFTLPLVVACLIGLAFADSIGFWLHGALGQTLGKLSPNAVAVFVIGGMMILFSFFNTFVNSVFWYLFNDVVPAQFLARFMSWFRMVSLGSSSLYSLVIFPYAGTHFRHILVGASLLYLVGFGLMCFVAAVKTFFVECHSHRHYWYVFLGSMAVAWSASINTFMLFFYQGTGLDLAQIGRIQSAISLTTAILIVGSGWLADRYHPIRVLLVGQCLQLLIVLPVLSIWLFWRPPAQVAFWAWLGMSVGLVAPVAALIGVGDPPLFMRLFPRERYGQFCSANAMWRSLGSILGGFLAGVFLDLLTRYSHVANVYAFLPVWQVVFYVPVVYAAYKLFKSWKHYGGDAAYQPPMPSPRTVLSANVPPPAAIAGTQGTDHGVDSVIASAKQEP
jgi:MFS family permease